MSQEQYNFLDELGLGKVIDNVKTMFAKLSHSHKLSDISDYTVDSAMSSTSTNPVQNKVINSALSGKVPTSRTINGKALTGNITLSASDVGAAASGHTHSAYVNQNAFSNVVVGSTTVAADSATDTLTLVAGSNVTITPDATNDKITIAAKDTVYTHPTTAGNKHIPSGGSSGQILRWSADGTAVWGADNNTTYSAATTSANGLMTSAMVTKLNGITDSADSVLFSQNLTSGTKVGTITINGTGTDLYAPTNTDTHYTSHLYVGASGGNANATSATSNPYLLCVDNTTNRNSVQLKAGSNMSISAVNGVVTFTATNTTYGTATTSSNGLMSSSDKTKMNSLMDEVVITKSAYSALGSSVNTNNKLYFVS